MKTIKISCPGKIILMGEHGVVYGKPAIVAAVNRRMTCEIRHPEFISGSTVTALRNTVTRKWILKQVQNDVLVGEIKSDIPIGCGMGSSAALAVIRAAMHVSTRKKINEMAYEQEKINHGQPSGVDNTICTYGGILRYQKINGQPVFKKLKISHLPEFVLINTGKPEETTKEMIERIKYKVESRKYKAETLRLFDEIERLTKLFLRTMSLREAKRRSNLIKDSIKNCEMCLEDLGVVGFFAKNVVRKIEQSGGVAKISGAGGLTGGSGMLLCYHENPQTIINLAKKLKLEAFKVELGGEGVKIEC